MAKAKTPAAPPSAPDEEILDEFKRLFRAARHEFRRSGRRANAEGAAYQAALGWARSRQIPGVEVLLAASFAYYTKKDEEAALARVQATMPELPEALLGHGFHVQGCLLNDLKRYDEAIACHQQALDTPGYDTPGDAHYNMGNAYADKKEHDRAIACYQEALDTLGYDTPGNAYNNMGTACAGKKEYDRAIACYQKALDTPGYDTPGIAHSNMGTVYANKKEHDRAIACYQKALDTPGYDTPGDAHYNMGLACWGKKEHDRAIACYQKALATPGYDTPGYAYNNMGIAYANKKEHDRAIACYQQALDTPGNDTPGIAHNNMGTAYGEKKEHDRAIACFQKALDTPGYDTPHLSRNNLANVLRLHGRHPEALAQVERVLAEPDTEDEHSRAGAIKRLIEEELAGLQPTVAEEALVKAESHTAAAATPERDMLQKLGYQEKGRKDKYDEYLQRDLPKRHDGFICLRGWSSAVTLLEGGEECQWSGGGYFLRWQGRGIVIDPGFDFVDNFHDAELHLKEMDAVLVSHNHSDHNYDLSSLDDLRYELHRRWKVLKDEEKEKHDVSRCLFVIDEDTAKGFRDDDAAHRGLPLKFSEADAQRGRWLVRENGLPVTIEHFKVEHGRDVPHAVGLRLRLHDDKTPDKAFLFGYTGDTRWHPALATHLQGCDVLLAHISMPAEEELLDDAEYAGLRGKEKEAGGFRDLPKDGFKAAHLGYRGMLELICEARPKMVLVGEFWAGLEDLRIDLVKGLRLRVKERTGLDIPILPTGLGFRLRLPSLEIDCTCCHKPVPHTELKIAPAASSFGPLGYLCPKCLG